MDKSQVMEWIAKRGLDGANYEKTAVGFIMADINEYDFETWLQLPHDYVVESFLETTYDVSNNLMSDLRTILRQEQELEEMGLEQTMRVDLAGLVEALNNGLLDVFRALQLYFQLQTEANELYNAHQN